MTAPGPGQAAYEAAATWEHENFGGSPFLLKPWADLSDRDRACWDKSAAAAIAAGRERPAPGDAVEAGLVRDILESACRRDGLSLESAVTPGEAARNYELAVRLGIGHVFGLPSGPPERVAPGDGKHDPLACPCCVYGRADCWCRADCGARRCQAAGPEAVPEPGPLPRRLSGLIAGWRARVRDIDEGQFEEDPSLRRRHRAEADTLCKVISQVRAAAEDAVSDAGAASLDDLKPYPGPLARVTESHERAMYAALIDIRRGHPGAARDILRNQLDGYDPPPWNGTDAGLEWLEKTRRERLSNPG